MMWDIFKQTTVNNGEGGHIGIREYIGALHLVDEMTIDEVVELIAEYYDCSPTDIELEVKL